MTAVCWSGACAKNVSSNRETCTSGKKASGSNGSGRNSYGSQTESVSCGSHGHGKYGCGDCYSEDCICSQFVITRRSGEKNRIKVVLVSEELGY